MCHRSGPGNIGAVSVCHRSGPGNIGAVSACHRSGPGNIGAVSVLTYLDTWNGFEAAKTAPWPSLGLHHYGKFLEPLDE